jgi:exodeoxyribonuclease V alpha subunit
MRFEETPEGKKYPVFYPKRNKENPLTLTHLIVEEASQVDIPLWKELYDALPQGCVVIFIGDINQLPPVFGPSVFNYALTQLPVIELTEIYRQALESPIIANAHRILRGEMPVEDKEFYRIYQSKPGSRLPTEGQTCAAFVNSWKKWYESGEYDVAQDIILTPINKDTHSCGSIVLNYYIAQYLGDKRGAKVHEVLAGRNKWYLAEGDRVMVDKQDGVITKIAINGDYQGKVSKSTISDINRFGHFTLESHDDSALQDDDFELTGYDDLNVDDIPPEEKKQAASHRVYVLKDDNTELEFDTAGDFSPQKFSLGYVISVHKSQGSEWRKTIIMCHKNFGNLLFRELLYTAATRAQTHVIIIDLTNYFFKAIQSQRVKGQTIKEKIELFNAKIVMNEPVLVQP